VINPPVAVDIVDKFGNLTSSDAGVTLIANGPGAFSAGSTTSVPAANGVTTFGNLQLNEFGSYTIGASSTGLTGASSAGFTINNVLPSNVVLTPSSGTNNENDTLALNGSFDDVGSLDTHTVANEAPCSRSGQSIGGSIPRLPDRDRKCSSREK
jgi:hypothetical protein